MNRSKGVATTLVDIGLPFGAAVQANHGENEGQTINGSTVPAAVQQVAQTEAKGGRLFAGKRRRHFEAGSEKNGSK